MSLLLLSCCAPCSCAVIEKLAKDNVDFTVLFYNPNIFPFGEYQKRLNENKRLCEKFNVPFVHLPGDFEEWKNAVKGMENEPERGKRCFACFYFRLKKAALYAKENSFSSLSSVLGISRHKDMNQVNRAGKTACEEIGFVYDDTNWRKGGLEPRRTHLIKELALYEQRYCGCPYSMPALNE